MTNSTEVPVAQCDDCGDDLDIDVQFCPTCCAHEERAVESADISDGGRYVGRTIVYTCGACGSEVYPDGGGFASIVHFG